MKEMRSGAEVVEEACARRIFNVIFRLISISDLYGSDRAVDWAQSLLDDPELLAAFAHPRKDLLMAPDRTAHHVSSTCRLPPSYASGSASNMSLQCWEQR